LRQAGHVQHADALALEMAGHAEHTADGDDAGAADASDQDAVRPLAIGQHGVGQALDAARLRRAPAGPAQPAAPYADEAGAEALEAGEILVAGGLVDAPLAPQLGLHRLDRHAIGLDGAIAAPFAHLLVDEDAARRIGHLAALAPAPLLRGAGLV